MVFCQEEEDRRTWMETIKMDMVLHREQWLNMNHIADSADSMQWTNLMQDNITSQIYQGAQTLEQNHIEHFASLTNQSEYSQTLPVL